MSSRTPQPFRIQVPGRSKSLAVLLVVCAVCVLCACKRSGDQPKQEPPTTSAPNARLVPIDVGEHGFTPNEITVKKGEATTLVFTRTSNSTCAFDVVFPELDVKKDLPMKKPVSVPIPVDKEATYAFTCGMGMYKSKVIVQ